MKTLILITAADRTALNEIARQMQHAIDGTNNGANTFTVAVHPEAAPDDTTPWGYWSAPKLTPANHTAAYGLLPSYPGCVAVDYDPVADLGFPDRKLAELNLRRAKAVLP